MSLGEVNPTALVTYGVFILVSSHTVLNNYGEMSFCLNPYFEHLILCFCKHECVYASWWAKVSLRTRSTTTRSTTLSKIPINAAIYLMCISGYQKGICATRVVIVVHCSCYIKSHELQGRDVPGQAAVAVVWNWGAFGGGVGYPARRDPTVWIWKHDNIQNGCHSINVTMMCRPTL